MATPWLCPHCNRETTITDSDIASGDVDLHLNNKQGKRKAAVLFIVCPSPRCKEVTLLSRYSVLKNVGTDIYPDWREDEVIRRWTLIPSSKGKMFPDYVPPAIRQDYEEGRDIEDRSPKAAATLARRCLQGMIRDFWGVSGHNLKSEIEAIKDKVDPLTWEAIDSVRRIGNIGAHMEKDINLIIDVDVEEASLLLGLVETLIKEWYVNREERRQQLEAIRAIAQTKDAAKKNK